MFFTLFLWSLVQLQTPTSSGRMVERIEARIGSQIVTTSELRATEALLRQIQPKTIEDKTLRQRALDMLIEQALIRDFLAKKEMNITDQEIDRRINSMRSAQGLENFEELQKLLATKGGSVDQLRTDLRMQLENQAFYSALKRESIQSIQESELRNYFQQNKEQFKDNQELSVQECLIPIEDPKADAIVTQFATKPAIFDECVRLHSQSPSKARNGMLGSIGRGLLRDEVESILFKTPVGQVAKVQLPNAVQLLKVLSKKNLGAQSFEQARSQIESLLEAERLNVARERVLNELKSQTFIKVES